MPLSALSATDERLASPELVGRVRDALGSCGSAVVLVPSFAQALEVQRALAAELLEKGRVHLDEIYSQRMDKYYPGDLILHDNGERATYYLSFRGGKK